LIGYWVVTALLAFAIGSGGVGLPNSFGNDRCNAIASLTVRFDTGHLILK
jgi:hypothetical protein